MVMPNKPNIALAHDSFTQEGGAERVIEALHELFPDAPVFTLVIRRQFREKYKSWDIRTSWLQVLFNWVPKLQFLLPLIPWAVSSFNFSEFDLVISSSSGFIKNIRVPKAAVHINYCHTPTRFLWSDENYINQEVPFLIRPFIKRLLIRMKKSDFKGAQRVNFFIANSREVQKRIKIYYQRESQLIYPFVDTDFWNQTKDKENYFLLAGRLQAHKRNDLIVEIFNKLGLPLHVAGVGRQEKYLRSIAKQNIIFLGRLADEQLRDQYSGALGFIFPQLEDFGLMPLEAASCGTATLAFGKGGALETIIPGVTGEFFNDYDERSIEQLILNWDATKYKFSELREQAKKFGKQNFKLQIQNYVKLLLNKGI
jgi:glycosyltransferase involved in cell wall biosynthesis